MNLIQKFVFNFLEYRENEIMRGNVPRIQGLRDFVKKLG